MRCQINPLLCNGCHACIAVCPHGAIDECMRTGCSKCLQYCLSMNVPCTPKPVRVREELCDGCGRCLAVCPVGAIGEVLNALEA